MSIMKKILAVVATVSMLATSMVAYADAPTVKTALMTGEELEEYTGAPVGGGVKISFEDFDNSKTLGGFVFSVMIPSDLKVLVNTGTAMRPKWETQDISEANILGAVDSSISWTAVKLQGTDGSFYKYGFTAGGQNFATSDVITIFFTTDAETYELPEKAFEIRDMSLSYSGESNPIALTVKNYFDGAVPPAPVDPEITPDNGAVEEGETADAKTWAVAVDADYVAAGDVLVATLTNSNFTGEDATQVVELTVGNDVEGGADWAFNLKVRFKDVAQRAATTLAIAKAAN